MKSIQNKFILLILGCVLLFRIEQSVRLLSNYAVDQLDSVQWLEQQVSVGKPVFAVIVLILMG